MLPINQIICPVDFSDPSNEALAVAGELTRHFKAELIVLHVAPPVSILRSGVLDAMGEDSPVMHANLDVDSYQREMNDHFISKLDSLIKDKLPEDVVARPKVRIGEAAMEIIEEASGKETDLVVIATHGRTGWRHFVFGSVAEEVIRHSTTPVLTIREPKGSDD